MSDNTKKNTLGLSENTIAVLCYAFGWLGGIVFLVLEKHNTFIRFHALQSVATFLTLFILSFIAHFIPFLGWILVLFLPLLSIWVWLLLMYKAYLGEKYQLPWIGKWVNEHNR